jgi:valyl-tRNA synthetase
MINDYAIGKRHSLPMTNILNKDATLNEEGGPYKGLDRYKCREQLWEDMASAGLTIKVEKHTQRVPRSDRSGEVIEPMISSQWFVKMDGMAKKACDAVRNGDIQIIPERFEKTYFDWLENIRDWCVSRQLWWGHRIPVWYAEGHPGKYFVARTVAEAQKQAEAELGGDVTLRQDEDVLDTWFSSGLWPFATVGWPASDEALLEEYNRFYPSSVMETGYDILFFWVARMVMLGIEFTGKPPFHTIYMHGLVRDGQGQKMSKTKGNVIDPIETIEEYGTDALRYSLVTGCTPGQDVPLAMEKVTANRNFANKLWNTGRFIVMGMKDLPQEERSKFAVHKTFTSEEIAALPLPERWAISRCHQLIGTVTSQLKTYDFSPAGMAIQDFLWDEFSLWYLEISKKRVYGAETEAELEACFNARRVLIYILDSCLRLLHPYMPFLTEEIWQQLPHDGPSLMVASWPQMGEVDLPIDEAAISDFGRFQSVVTSVRQARADYKVDPGKYITAKIFANSDLGQALKQEADAIAALATLDAEALEIELWSQEIAEEVDDSAARLLVGEELEVVLPLAGMIDFAKERTRLEKQKEKLEGDIGKLNGRLSNPAFVEKASPAVVDKAKAEYAQYVDQLEEVVKALGKLPA